MSAGKLLVENERKQEAVLCEAKHLLTDVLVALGRATGSASDLAELDVAEARLLVERIATQRSIMRNLLREHDELSAATAN
jgi:K+-transporting ATPase c subunit